MDQLIKNNYNIIRVYQHHVYHDKFDWRQYINNCMDYINANKCKTSIFIFKKHEKFYQKHLLNHKEYLVLIE